MIPKIIHYVWLGKKPLDKKSKKCLKSWKKHCPDYMIICWNENNFDINFCDYTREAYAKKQWAFISDVIRLYALVDKGGIYLDTDVELLGSLDMFLNKKAFAGFNDDKTIGTSLLAGEKDFHIYKKFLNDYMHRHFILEDGSLDQTPNVEYLTDICRQFGFLPNNKYQNINGLEIYPLDYFCAKSYITNKLLVTDKTVCIHHFSGSWTSKKYKFIRFIGPKATKVLVKLKHVFTRKKE